MVAVPDWVIYAGYAGLLGVILGWALARARAPRQEPVRAEQERAETREPTREERQEQVSLDNVLGLDKALAAKFYRSLRKSLGQGEVRVALVSDKCPDGYVAYDFVREDWICVEKDGSSYRLGGRPLPEEIKIEDLEEVARDGG